MTETAALPSARVGLAQAARLSPAETLTSLDSRDAGLTERRGICAAAGVRPERASHPRSSCPRRGGSPASKLPLVALARGGCGVGGGRRRQRGRDHRRDHDDEHRPQFRQRVSLRKSGRGASFPDPPSRIRRSGRSLRTRRRLEPGSRRRRPCARRRCGSRRSPCARIARTRVRRIGADRRGRGGPQDDGRGRTGRVATRPGHMCIHGHHRPIGSGAGRGCRNRRAHRVRRNRAQPWGTPRTNGVPARPAGLLTA